MINKNLNKPTKTFSSAKVVKIFDVCKYKGHFFQLYWILVEFLLELGPVMVRFMKGSVDVSIMTREWLDIDSILSRE